MDIQDNWPYSKITLDEGEAAYDIAQSMETQLDRIDVEIDELAEQRFIDTATDKELEKLALEVGIRRKTGESDESLRFRTQLAKAISRTDGKLDELAQLFNLLFGEDAKRLSLSSTGDYPVVTVSIPTEFIENVPITKGEFEDQLSGALPSGDAIELLSQDAFAFAGGASGKGFDEGTWS